MMGLGFRREKAKEAVEARGYDAFELRLGDLMRGERATLGKSLLDVQRDLKIRATYIAAIENCDPTAFETPGFIAGNVRSYARYLGMDPDWAFETFCRESGFVPAHGMSPAASSIRASRPSREDRLAGSGLGKDIFASSATPFVPQSDGWLRRIEPRALGSVVILALLAGGLGFGTWSVLQEVQRVQIAPVDEAPSVVAEVDPLAGGGRAITETEAGTVLQAASPEGLERLYRPQALEVPVVVSRDGPIAAVDPSEVGAFAEMESRGGAVDDVVAAVLDAAGSDAGVPMVQVTEGPVPELQLVAARPAWVRVNAADGSVLFEGVLDAGDRFDVPVTEDPPFLRVGESGALYFAVNGVPHGPVGSSGTVTSNVELSPGVIVERWAVADITGDPDLAGVVRVADAAGLDVAGGEETALD